MNSKIKSRMYAKKYAEELLQIAEGDLDAGIVLRKYGTKRKENVFFHLSQTIEKSMKSILCYKQIAVPLTHDLLVVLSQLPDAVQFPFGAEIGDLTEFATTRRYEEGKVLLTDEEADAVIDIAQQVLSWAKNIIKQ